MSISVSKEFGSITDFKQALAKYIESIIMKESRENQRE
ncbi:transposase [Bacillus cereus]|nr:transposase [Bacillus cereus]